jgi:hypothetical protein
MFRSSPIFFRRLKGAVAASLLLSCAAQHLAAEPLDKDACGKLQAEKQSLVVLGVDKEFAKGPDWAKANLAQAELDLLKRFLTVEEQLKFRCGMAVVHLQIPDDAEDGPDGEAAPTAGTGVPIPHRREQASSAAKPAAKPPVAPARSEPAVVKPAKPVVKPAPKAQSSWNTETAPVEAPSPAAIDQLNTRPAPARTVNPGGGRG